MRFFRRKTKKRFEAIDNLRDSTLDCIFTVSEKIINAIESEQSILSDEGNYGIKQEVLCFYLIYIDRVAMKDNNISFYERLQGALVISTCELFVDMQFNTKEMKTGFDVEKWRTGMVKKNVDLYNERGENYSSLPLVSEQGLFSDGSVLAKVVENIDGLLAGEQYDDLRLISEIPFWLIQKANDNELVKRVDDMRIIFK